MLCQSLSFIATVAKKEHRSGRRQGRGTGERFEGPMVFWTEYSARWACSGEWAGAGAAGVSVDPVECGGRGLTLCAASSSVVGMEMEGQW